MNRQKPLHMEAFVSLASPWLMRRVPSFQAMRMLWRVTASRTSSIQIRARSSRARPSPVCSPTTTLDFYNRASEHPSGYVIEGKRLC
jgi:hypothetical protein